MTEKKMIVSNSDDEWPYDCESDDEVNGSGAEEIQGLDRQELIQRVMNYTEIDLDAAYFFFLYGQMSRDIT